MDSYELNLWKKKKKNVKMAFWIKPLRANVSIDFSVFLYTAAFLTFQGV